MKRRELIKLGSTILGSASIGAITGYGIKSAVDDSQSQKKVSNDSTFSITPKQTAPYEYSSPMPFNKKLIDELYDLNQKLTKGKITVLYSSFPGSLAQSIHPAFIASRGDNPDIRTVDDYLDYVKYAISKGFKCAYTLNTTVPFNDNDLSLTSVVVPIFKKLYQEGISDVKISNPALLNLFSEHLDNFNIHLSTTAEYHDIQVYKNLFYVYPKIKSINLSTDDNHNFQFLDSLRKILPEVKLEMLVNESGCIKNCPIRCYHPVANSTYPCMSIMKANPYLHLAKNNLVHPWHLEYYSALGINNFKFVSMPFPRSAIGNINYIKYYLEFVEKGTDEYSANDIVDKLYYGIQIQDQIRFKKNYNLTKFIDKYLPDIEHFIKHGEKCASECDAKCKYCYKFADKLKEFSIKV